MPSLLTLRRSRVALVTYLTLASLLPGMAHVAASGQSIHVHGGMQRHAPAVSPLIGGWKNLTATSPQPAAGSALAWDDADGVFFVFGGASTNAANGDLWAYRPLATKTASAGWTRVTTRGNRPGPRAGASMVWDTADGVLLLLNGVVDRRETSELWAYKPGRGGIAPGRWTNVAPGASPLRRAYQTAVWDSADNVVLMFGGATNGIPSSETWSYKPPKGALRPGKWTRVTASGPAPRQQTGAAWDANDRLMLLVGGQGYGGLLSDAWALRLTAHGAAGRWTRLSSAIPQGARAGAATVWDAANRRLLVFGGQVPTPTPPSLPPTRTPTPENTPTPTSTATPTPSATNTDTPVPPTNTPVPPPPTDTPVPPATDTPVPTATSTSTNTPPATATNTATATPTSTATATPTSTATATSTSTTAATSAAPVAHANALTGPALTRDGAQSGPRSVLLSGGVAYANDLWAFSLSRRSASAGTWTRLGQGGPAPRLSAAVYDSRDRSLLLFGGQSLTLLGDVWAYRVAGAGAGRWTLRDGGKPQARAGQATAWDARDNVLFLFGGFSGVWLKDLWAYKASRGGNGRWALVATPDGPDVRTEATMVWDSADNAALLFGGSNRFGGLNDVWAYRPAGDGTGVGNWTRLAITGAPAGRHLHTAIWDSKDRQMIVLGGETSTAVLGDLWAFHPNLRARTGTWSLLMGATPLNPRFAHTAVWDPSGNGMFVFGGVNGAGHFLNDLWIYRPGRRGGSGWSSLGTPTNNAPDGRAQTAMAWDTADNAVVIFAGNGLKNFRNDAYYYRMGRGWAPIVRDGAPDRRQGATAVYDTLNNGYLLYGGAGFSTALNDLWQLGGLQPPAPKPRRSPSYHHSL